MKNVSELTDFYYKSLYPVLKELEDERKKVKEKIVKFGLFYTSITVFFAYILKDILFQDTNNFAFFIIGYFAIGGFLYKSSIKDYTYEFKQRVIEPLIHAIDKDLQYSSKLHVEDYFVNGSGIFIQEIDKVDGNDFVKGKIDGINIEFSDIHAQKKHEDSKGHESWSTIFKGLFIVSEFNKNFRGKTIILPDTAQKTFGDIIGNWLQSNNASRNELVKMDNVEFEKKFVVYATDQIEARYILTHSLMSRLLKFQKRTKHPIYVSFVAKNIHIAIEYNKDLFEPSVFHSLLEYKVAMEYVKILHLAIGVVQELKLNQKLWSKV